MKKPKRIVGFINYRDIEYPYEFDEEHFCLKLYPSTQEQLVADREATFKRHFAVLSQESVEELELFGTASTQTIDNYIYNITFGVRAIEESFAGFITLPVNWYFIQYSDENTNRIDGFRVKGNDVNLFFPPTAVLDITTFDEEHQKISVNHTSSDASPCGTYQLTADIGVKLSASAYTTLYFNSSPPLEATSEMLVEFTNSGTIHDIITAYRDLYTFFIYASYRNNIILGDADVFFYNEDGFRSYSGLFSFCHHNKVHEISDKAKNLIIPYSILNTLSSHTA